MNPELITRKIFAEKEEWKDFRKGLFTASNIHKLMAKPKNDLSDGAISYILELIQNVYAEPKLDHYNAAMQWGLDNEAQAAARYADILGLSVNDDRFIYTSVGGFVFFIYDEKAGGTPDIILQDHLCEIKCPNSDTHLYYKLFVNAENFAKKLPVYYDQIQMNLFLAQREKAVFMSYDPRFKKEANQVHLIELNADKERQSAIFQKIEIAHDFKTKLIENL